MSINKINQTPITLTPYKNSVSSGKNISGCDFKNVLNASSNAPNSDVFEKFEKDEQNSSILSQLEAMKKNLEESEKNNKSSINDLSKAMKIASRIMNGDKVPMKDRKFLAEKYPDLFKNALMFRKQNPEPKKYKSCLDKEDEETNDNNLSVTGSDDGNASFLADALSDLGE
ncbi:MAG: hypothetical protein NC203_08825 [Firmicutes bacterium]|nr:hypothetical protein [[Eubacterium] siraeum]MCM1488456.1 hypothetical protein [Bacillota bacterium]